MNQRLHRGLDAGDAGFHIAADCGPGHAADRLRHQPFPNVDATLEDVLVLFLELFDLLTLLEFLDLLAFLALFNFLAVLDFFANLFQLFGEFLLFWNSFPPSLNSFSFSSPCLPWITSLDTSFPLPKAQTESWRRFGRLPMRWSGRPGSSCCAEPVVRGRYPECRCQRGHAARSRHSLQRGRHTHDGRRGA